MVKPLPNFKGKGGVMIFKKKGREKIDFVVLKKIEKGEWKIASIRNRINKDICGLLIDGKKAHAFSDLTLKQIKEILKNNE